MRSLLSKIDFLKYTIKALLVTTTGKSEKMNMKSSHLLLKILYTLPSLLAFPADFQNNQPSLT